MENNRKFSIPFNGSNPHVYLEKIKKYKNCIHDIYIGVPSLCNNHINIINCSSNSSINNIEEYDKNCKEFLQITKNENFNIVLTINSAHYNMSNNDIHFFVHTTLRDFIVKYNIKGIIITNFYMGEIIRSIFSDIDIYTSCNCFQWNIKQMEYWDKKLNITLFNPPREYIRNIELMKSFKRSGFKIKALINEACLMYCPKMLNHTISLSFGKDTENDIINGEYENVFKGTYILPRWIKYYDDYVDVYKIAGRTRSTDFIFKCLDSYINELDNIYISDIVDGCILNTFNNLNIKIPTKMFSDKLRYCNCENCDICKTCYNLGKILMKTKTK